MSRLDGVVSVSSTHDWTILLILILVSFCRHIFHASLVWSHDIRFYGYVLRVRAMCAIWSDCMYLYVHEPVEGAGFVLKWEYYHLAIVIEWKPCQVNFLVVSSFGHTRCNASAYCRYYTVTTTTFGDEWMTLICTKQKLIYVFNESLIFDYVVNCSAFQMDWRIFQHFSPADWHQNMTGSSILTINSSKLSSFINVLEWSSLQITSQYRLT